MHLAGYVGDMEYFVVILLLSLITATFFGVGACRATGFSRKRSRDSGVEAHCFQELRAGEEAIYTKKERGAAG